MLESVFWVVSLQRMKVFSDFLFAVLAENFQICRKQKYTAYDRFHGNGPYGKIPTKKEPIRTRGFTSRLPCHIITWVIPTSVKNGEIRKIILQNNSRATRGKKSIQFLKETTRDLF